MELRSLERLTAGLAYAGLIAKAGFFALIFWWATTSDVGHAVLRGAVLADLFTWCVFSTLDWPFRRLQVKLGALFEAALVLVYLFRDDLFEMPEAAESLAAAFLSFLLFAGVKLAVWGVEHALEASGVSERGSR